MQSLKLTSHAVCHLRSNMPPSFLVRFATLTSSAPALWKTRLCVMTSHKATSQSTSAFAYFYLSCSVYSNTHFSQITPSKVLTNTGWPFSVGAPLVMSSNQIQHKPELASFPNLPLPPSPLLLCVFLGGKLCCGNPYWTSQIYLYCKWTFAGETTNNRLITLSWK